MIPAPPRISAPPRRESRPRPAVSSAPALAPPRDLPCPGPHPAARPAPRGSSPATRPKANDADISTLPPRHQRFRPTTRLSARAMHVGCRVSSTRLCVTLGTMLTSAPSHHKPDGICRSNNSMNVALYLIDSVERHVHGKSARGAAWRLRLAVNVRRTQRVALVRGAGLSSGAPVARHRVEHTAEWAGRRDSEDPAPTPCLAWGREIPPVRRKLPNGTMGGLARVRARLGTWQGLHGYA